LRAAALAVGLAVLPLVLGSSSVLLHDVIVAAAYVVMALGLNVVVGFAGLLDLGYVAFYAIGAHVAAHLGSAFWARAHFSVLVDQPNRPGIHLNFLLILVAAIAATTLAGMLIGVPTLRLRGDYVGVVTLAFGEIIGLLVANGREITFLGGSLTGGPNGIAVIDKIDLPLLGRFGTFDLRPWYWFALVMVGAALLVSVRLRDSRPGRAWRALRDDERAAAAAGVPIARAKLAAYGAGAAFGGVAGAFLASYSSVANPHQFTFAFSIFVLAMVVLGGLGSIRGVVVGAVILSLVDSYVLPRVVELSELSSGIYGMLLVLLMLLRPRGLL
jgi:branched-chain amino acid transport system permease protein